MNEGFSWELRHGFMDWNDCVRRVMNCRSMYVRVEYIMARGARVRTIA